MIYNYVFEFHKIAASAYRCFVSMPSTAVSTQPGTRCNPQIMLALLLVDRETLREAAEQFYGHRLFSIGSSVYPHSPIQFLRGIGKRRLDLITSLRYSVTLCGDGHRDASGKWHQTFWQLSRSQWRVTFRYLSQARGLRTLEIDLGTTASTRSGLTPDEWSEMETCLVDIKGRVDLCLCNGCQVFVKDHPVECEGMTSIMASHKNLWTCKQGETEWSPMESVYRPEWFGKKPEGVLKRSYKGLNGACSVQRTS